jgi:hypothetical protein
VVTTSKSGGHRAKRLTGPSRSNAAANPSHHRAGDGLGTVIGEIAAGWPDEAAPLKGRSSLLSQLVE